MMLLALLSWPYLKKHVLRWVLTIAGIVLGVAVFIAMHSANQSVFASFDRTVNRIAGAAQLEVSAGDFGFPEEVLERVQNVPEVEVAVPVIEAAVDTGRAGEGTLLILGVDMTGDRSLRDYELESGEEAIIDDPLVFLAQPDSIMLAREFAERNRLAIGSQLALKTMAGEKRFTVRGIMKAGGLARAFGGNLAIMDIYAVQKVFGRGRHFDRIDLRAKEGVAVERCRAAVERALGPGYTVEPPSERRGHFEAMLRSYSITMNVSSLFALVIGLFIIYNSFAIAVTQRRAEVGILRALGATRAQVRRLFLAESVVAGLLGSALGVLAGIGMARAIAVYLSRFMQQVFGVPQNVEDVAVAPWLLAAGLLLGVATSMLAAWIPARNAARVDPVQALQKGKYQVLSAGENRFRAAAALACALISAACLAFGHARLLFYFGYLLAILTALLLTPALALGLARLLRPPLKLLRPVEGALAADSLAQAPRRTSATVSALMLSVAMVIGFGGIARSIYRSALGWVDEALNPDFFVTGSPSIANRQFSFPGTIGADIAALDGVSMTQMVKSSRILFRGVPITLVSGEIGKLSQTIRRRALVGDTRQAYRLAAEGRGAIVSDAFANLRGVGYGGTLEIPTPSGLLKLPVVGVTRDFSDPQGSILIDLAVFREWWRDDGVNIVRVYLNKGAEPREVKRRILDRFPGLRLFVLSNREVREEILRLTDQWFGMTYNQIAIAVLVAVLGIVNTLIVSITDRRRELGVLQAVGGLRRQIRHTVWMEALAIGTVGLLLGLALGAVNLYYSLGLTRDIGGIWVDYIYPAPIAAGLVPVILGAALVAALWPAEHAVRGSLVEALEYE